MSLHQRTNLHFQPPLGKSYISCISNYKQTILFLNVNSKSYVNQSVLPNIYVFDLSYLVVVFLTKLEIQIIDGSYSTRSFQRIGDIFLPLDLKLLKLCQRRRISRTAHPSIDCGTYRRHQLNFTETEKSVFVHFGQFKIQNSRNHSWVRRSLTPFLPKKSLWKEKFLWKLHLL